jgi:phosphotriesterase-related protein
MLSRREVLMAASGMLFAGAGPAAANGERVRTVEGEVAPEELGTVLIHEHVMVDFVGADRVSPERYDADEVYRVVLPHLRQARALGCRTLVECTPAYLGRDPALLKRLASASGVRLITNTGYYGAANDKFLPKHAFDESAEQLAERWTREAQSGIDGTGIRPGFIKIGVDPGPLSEIDAKLVHAAALAHRRTGLTIAAHTGNGEVALAEIALLERERVLPAAFIWVHAQIEPDAAIHERAARRGAWVEFDSVSENSVAAHVERVTAMKAKGLLGNVLVSHDAGWYNVGEPNGGAFRPYDTLFTKFVPALKEAGLTDGEIRRLLVENPRRALTPAKRLRS